MRRSIIFACLVMAFPMSGLSQEALTSDDGVMQYVVPDPELDIFTDETAPQNDQMFLGIELEVLERRVETLETENEQLRARLDLLEAALLRGGQ